MMKAAASAGPKKPDASMQFQIEAENETQWRALLRREGLILIDVYTGWAGPCVSMVAILKRVKVEVNDERLWYGMACSDNIDDLVKFKNKSEPCWLFIGGGKPIKVIRGSHVPTLVQAIKTEFEHEIECIEGKSRRNFISIDDEVNRKLKLEAEAAKLAALVVEEEEAAESLNEIRRESSISLMSSLDPYTCVIIQPFVVKAGKAKEIKDYLCGDFNILQEVTVDMTEAQVRQLYRIQWEVPDLEAEMMEFGFDMGVGSSASASITSSINPINNETEDYKKKSQQVKPKKPKRKMKNVPLPEGLTGECQMVLLEQESIRELAGKKQKPFDTLLQTADDWIRMRVGPLKFSDAVEHAPYCLHATYGKEGDHWPGVWCPRKYEDKRFVILNFFPSFMDTLLNISPIETRKYMVWVFAANAGDAMALNTDIQANKFDINAEGKIRIPDKIAEGMLKSWEVKKADMIMKMTNLTSNDVYVVSFNPKNSVLKGALTLMSPVHQSKDEMLGRMETAKLFPDLNLSVEEESTPEQFVEKFLGRTKRRIESVTVMEDDEELLPEVKDGDADDDDDDDAATTTDSVPAPEVPSKENPPGPDEEGEEEEEGKAEEEKKDEKTENDEEGDEEEEEE